MAAVVVRVSVDYGYSCLGRKSKAPGFFSFLALAPRKVTRAVTISNTSLRDCIVYQHSRSLIHETWVLAEIKFLCEARDVGSYSCTTQLRNIAK